MLLGMKIGSSLVLVRGHYKMLVRRCYLGEEVDEHHIAHGRILCKPRIREESDR